MITTAIILAGGLGTRLRPVVSGLPKCMAPIAGKPFLHYLVSHFKKQGIQQFIFSLGYKNEIITDWLEKNLDKQSWTKVIETHPLGTGGAIQLAAKKAKTENVLVLNGDTLFAIELEPLSRLHSDQTADCTLCLKPMQQIDRYGVVEMEGKRIISFKEKDFYEQGLINGGVYALNIPRFLKEAFPEIFSFEIEYLQALAGKRNFMGLEQDRYFIDIGIPADYQRAQQEFADL